MNKYFIMLLLTTFSAQAMQEERKEGDREQASTICITPHIQDRQVEVAHKSTNSPIITRIFMDIDSKAIVKQEAFSRSINPETRAIQVFEEQIDNVLVNTLAREAKRNAEVLRKQCDSDPDARPDLSRFSPHRRSSLPI